MASSECAGMNGSVFVGVESDSSSELGLWWICGGNVQRAIERVLVGGGVFWGMGESSEELVSSGRRQLAPLEPFYMYKHLNHFMYINT